MKYIILLSIIISSLFVSEKLVAQNYQETLQFAFEQYDNENYAVALKTFKRLIFFNTDGDLLPLYIAAGNIAIHEKEYETAQFNFGLAYNIAESDSLKNELLFKKAYSQILSKKYQYAIIDLLAINDYDIITKQKLNFFLGTCYFGLEQFDRSKKYFENCLKPGSKGAFDILFTHKNLYTPSPKKAKILSMILPGLGQFYVGSYKDGINSLALSLGLIIVGVRTATNSGVLFALVSVFPWYQRYYTGGFNKAERMSVLKRQNKRSDLYNKIIEIIEQKQLN